MKLYQVVLNSVSHDSPIFSSLEGARKVVADYSKFMKKRGCDVVVDTPDKFTGVWGGWNSTSNTIWIKDIEDGKIPVSWDWK